MNVLGRISNAVQGLFGTAARPVSPASPAVSSRPTASAHARFRDSFEPARRPPLDLSGRGVSAAALPAAEGPVTAPPPGNGFLASLDDVAG